MELMNLKHILLMMKLVYTEFYLVSITDIVLLVHKTTLKLPSSTNLL